LDDLLRQLMTSTVLVAATVLLHLVGIDFLTSLIGLHLRRFTTAWLHLDRLLVPLVIVLGLFTLHGLEIWIYAAAYRLLDIMPTLESALYISASTYSTLGEAGQLLPTEWRVVGALEAVNGMLLIGWSTAFLFQVLDHLQSPSADDHPLPKGAIARPRRRSGV
jgi:voltage-gated potassium channel